MADILCGYTADRDETLVAYLYGEIEPAPRAAFEAHIATCERCRQEVSALSGARLQLRHWAAPDVTRSVLEETRDALPARRSGHSARLGMRTTWRDLPAWAQVAAALLFLGVSAGIANLDVRYDRNGVSLRTGWSRQPSRTDATRTNTLRAGAETTSPTSPVNVDTAPRSQATGGTSPAAPWRADLNALERQLRTEFHGSAPTGAPATLVTRAPAAPAAATSPADAQLLRRVRTLIEDSERRQQNELALRIAEAFRDVNQQRQADLVRINQSLGLVQNNTRIDAARQRQLLDYVVQRVSSQK